MNVHQGATTIGRNSPSLDAFWMPFTANRQFKQAPRLLAAAEGRPSCGMRRRPRDTRHL